MRRKRDSNILFTNAEFAGQEQVQRGSRQRSQPKPRVRTLDFKYNFRDYLKLSLAKKMPRNGQLTFIPEKGIIIGEEHLCLQLTTLASEEFYSHKFCVMSFKDQRELAEKEYWLDEGAKIYRPAVIQVALEELEKLGVFKDQIEEMRDNLKKNRFLLRVEKARESEVLSNLEEAMRQKEPTHEHSLTSFEESASRTEDSNNFYRFNQEGSRDSIVLDSIMESSDNSINITETETEEGCVYSKNNSFSRRILPSNLDE